MPSHAIASCPAASLRWPPAQVRPSAAFRTCACATAFLLLAWALPSRAIVLWSDLGATLVHETGPGADILSGALKRDDSFSDTLYFKFHVDLISDASTEEYFAVFELYEGDSERLGVGNALKAWAYSVFVGTQESGNKADNYIDLHSAKPEPVTAAVPSSYELPRRGIGRTIVFK